MPYFSAESGLFGRFVRTIMQLQALQCASATFRHIARYKIPPPPVFCMEANNVENVIPSSLFFNNLQRLKSSEGTPFSSDARKQKDSFCIIAHMFNVTSPTCLCVLIQHTFPRFFSLFLRNARFCWHIGTGWR